MEYFIVVSPMFRYRLDDFSNEKVFSNIVHLPKDEYVRSTLVPITKNLMINLTFAVTKDQLFYVIYTIYHFSKDLKLTRISGQYKIIAMYTDEKFAYVNFTNEEKVLQRFNLELRIYTSENYYKLSSNYLSMSKQLYQRTLRDMAMFIQFCEMENINRSTKLEDLRKINDLQKVDLQHRINDLQKTYDYKDLDEILVEKINNLKDAKKKINNFEKEKNNTVVKNIDNSLTEDKNITKKTNEKKSKKRNKKKN